MLMRFFRWLFAGPEFPPEPKVAEVEPEDTPSRASFFTTDIDGSERLLPHERLARLNALAFPPTKTRVVDVATGQDGMTFATDATNGSDSLKSVFALNQVGIPDSQAMWYGSQGFIGYQMCAILAQHWLINKACLVPARDAVRRGWTITVNDGSQVAPDVLAAMTKAEKRYKLRKNLVEFVKMGRVFGIRIAMCVISSDDPEYYVKPFNPDGIAPGSYRGITQIDPYWCVPELSKVASADPSAIDFYEPTYWIINGKRYHKSHLIVMRGPDVADILKPSYLYGGLSVPQMIYERVYASERTANEAPQLALTKRAMIFYTDAAKALANQGAFESKLSLWAQFRDNFGVKVADKEADKIEQHDTSLSELDAVIMSQYQLVAAAANVPATKLLGTTPKGFNSSGDYETDSYHEELESIQTNDMEHLLDRHNVCVIRSDIAPRFGIKPFGVDVTWQALTMLSDAEQANVNKTKAETDKILAVDIGSIDGAEVRRRVATDKNSGHNGLPVLENQDDAPPIADQ